MSQNSKYDFKISKVSWAILSVRLVSNHISEDFFNEHSKKKKKSFQNFFNKINYIRLLYLHAKLQLKTISR